MAEPPSLSERGNDVGEQEVTPSDAESQAAEERAVEARAGQVASGPAQPASTEHDGDAPANGKRQSGENAHLFLGDGWAQWAMAITGFFALCASVWAVWLLRETLKATRDAVGEAEAATKAAQDAVNVTQTLGQNQLRAYMTLWPKFGWFVHPIKSDESGLKLSVLAQNTGQTPANECEVFAHVMVAKAAYDRFDPGKAAKRRDSMITCGAGRYIPTVDFDIKSERLLEIIQNDRRIFFYVRVNYKDVFERTFFAEGAYTAEVFEVPPMEDKLRREAAVVIKPYPGHHKAT